ncbi:hypothetical protein SuNHUV7_15460 (plasmid) [Pseudoseohaeicola sp. NH-UV-7]|uniref:hypothetical protein n=1 Tax=Sulfitobacter sp. TBRI5 TaxID=2989732 RepID=UPI003A7A3E79
MNLRLSAFICMALALPALAQQSPDFPRNGKLIIQLTSSQFASGFGEYLVPPLVDAFQKTGMVYAYDFEADFAATVETGADVGKWYEADETADVAEVWLYERFVTVGLSPAEMDIEPHGKLAPSFSITVKLVTPDQDRVDELNCLIALATRELAARYKAKGHVLVDGSSCARK